jgi:hypothetical protein
MTDVAEKTYVRFTEENDWEGETWHFYLRVQGNEEALQRLAELVNDSEEYTLDLGKHFSEAEVTTLVDNADGGGYMADHNRADGRLGDLPDDPDRLYKGQIVDFVKAD